MELPEFAAEAVQDVARLMGIICDAEREAVLLHRRTVDIRACAGSGKTTLLVAKLALMMRSWKHRHRGMCIISHTNVAHEEIRRRFANLPILRPLEAYPHFLGTIQSFLGMTLGTPGAIAYCGVRPAVVDDDHHARQAQRLIGHDQYARTRGWLHRQHNGDAILHGLRLEYAADGSITVGSSGGDLPGAHTPTTQGLAHLKQQLLRGGVYRYDDLDACAAWYAKKYPMVLRTTAHRFPVVFIDETQDTSLRQGNLLDLIFGGRSVVQRFGDDRQAIYRGGSDDDAGIVFPNVGNLSMTTSLRISPSIAALTENVCVGDVERLAGRDGVPAKQHSVFLFSPDRIESVLPAFASLVATEVGVGLPSSRVVAIGFRRSGAVANEHLPGVISDYWSAGDAGRRPVTASCQTLAEYVSASVADLSVGASTSRARTRMLQAACRLLELQGVRNDGRPFSPASLDRAICQLEPRHAPPLLKLISRILIASGTSAALGLQEIADGLWTALSCFALGDRTSQTDDFFRHPIAQHISAAQHRPSDGVFRLDLPSGQVRVSVGTIHSVKGETVDAALVLTTYFRGHDLKKLVDTGILRNRRPSTAHARQETLKQVVKRTYVAMTRPTSLLCLAIPQAHVSSPHQREMERAGWTIRTV